MSTLRHLGLVYRDGFAAPIQEIVPNSLIHLRSTRQGGRYSIDGRSKRWRPVARAMRDEQGTRTAQASASQGRGDKNSMPSSKFSRWILCIHHLYLAKKTWKTRRRRRRCCVPRSSRWLRADLTANVRLSHRSAYGVNGGASGPGYHHTGHDEVLEYAVLFSILYLLGQNHLIFLQSMRSSNIEPVNWAAAKNQTCQRPTQSCLRCSLRV